MAASDWPSCRDCLIRATTTKGSTRGRPRTTQPSDLAKQVDAKLLNKHDHLLDEHLIDEAYGRRGFDLPSTLRTARRILREQEDN